MNREELSAFSVELIRIIGIEHMSAEWRAERVADLLLEGGIVSLTCCKCGEAGAIPAAKGSSLPGPAHFQCLDESPADACECPNCDDPTDRAECMRNFCSVCCEELGHDATWPEKCERCRWYGYTVENGGR